MMNRKDRRAQDKAARRSGQVSSDAWGHHFSGRLSGDPAQERRDFMRGTQFPDGVLLGQVLGDGDGDRPSDMPAILLNRKCLQQAPGLQRLFDLHERIGTVALNEQMNGAAGWAAMITPGEPQSSLVKLKLAIDEPHHVRTELLLIASKFIPALTAAARSDAIGLISPEGHARLQASGSSNFADFLDHCIVIATPQSIVLPQLLSQMRL